YAMGLIHLWARLAARMPRLVNRVASLPGLSRIVKKIGGIHPERSVPRFAEYTFRDWFRRRGGSSAPGQRVLLWPDTFNNFFHPEVGRAAVGVLEAVGFQPALPESGLCCGRPLYDFGMLDRARSQLREILDALKDEIRAGTPVVGIEPSCVATFREELVNLFPHDDDARRLASQTWVLSEFLMEHATDADLGTLSGRTALLHGHCHHTSVLDFEAERLVLERLDLELDVLDSGCCGMAGSFGFKEDHYEVAQACGERALLPAVRQAGDAMVVTSGFSCREMIEQNDLPAPLHVAEVIHAALERDGRATPLAEDPHVPASVRKRLAASASAP
ncbi:MAG TPA: heterodisulfide reductase-related iron-sulfur binding cluster, partial [Longimicrobiales bacterium]|nr:heterodisulfide reductase-related iron-sulfur binding cluster [Longimicrobiales bacterium]